MTSPRPVFTFTGNLLAEHTFEFETWSAGATQRARRQSFQVGGKGINVSKMLTRLGVANTALCFVGGASGAECETWLRERGFALRAFRSSSETRRGTVIRAKNRPETTFLGPDTPVDASAIRDCADFLDAQPPCVLALCGSIPGWTDASFEPLRAALVRWKARNGILVADTYGPPLAWLIRQPVDLLKVNAAEMRSIGLEPDGQALLPMAAVRTVITDGPGLVRAWDAGGAESFQAAPPRVEEVSPTGSGDVMLACLIHALFNQGKSLREAVGYALPFAAANAAHPGVAEFPFPAQVS